MYCNKCGTELQPGAKFCPKCGAPVPGAEAGQNPNPTPPNPTPPAPAPPTPDSQPNVALFVGLIAAAVGVAVGVGIWVWVAFLAPYPVDEATFPDPAVRTVVASTVDADGNGEVSRDEAAAATDFQVDGAANLDGVGRLPNLRSITVKGGALSSADVSPFGSLESFSAPDSSLASLDVSRNPALATLDVPDSTQVTGLEATQLAEAWLPDEIQYSYLNDDTGEYQRTTGNVVERDAHGVPLERTFQMYSYNSVSSTITTTYEYNDAGQLSRSVETYDSNSSGASPGTPSTYAYDDAGRLVSVTTGTDSPYKSSYAYDDAGRLKSITNDYSSSNEPYVNTINYDDQGRATSVTSNNDSLYAQWSYDDTGRLVGCQDPYGDSPELMDHKLTYDERGNVTSVSCGPGFTISKDYTPDYDYDYDTTVNYVYDENNRITSADSHTDYSSSSNDMSSAATCEYDDAGRISKVSIETHSPYEGVDHVYAGAYELSYGRYFVPRDDGQDLTYIYFVPTYGSDLFNIYLKTPGVPVAPDLETRFVCFQYNTVLNFYQ